jgi:hypothetical protein
MYKNFTIAILLATFGLVAMRSTGSPSAGSTPPAVVAKVVLQNQTAAIPTTTVYTPTVGGLYRISAYMTTPIPNEQVGNYWTFNLAWTDEAGVESTPSGIVTSNTGFVPPGAWGSYFGELGFTYVPGNVAIIQAVAGQPITYSVTSAVTSNEGIYSLYFTVERLI